MRHIVVYDRDTAGWAVVDTESAHMVVSLHDSRYAAASALSLPGSPGEATGLLVMKGPVDLDLSWQPSCSGESTDYAIHEGTLGDFASHTPLTCSTGGSTNETVTAGDGNRYFLVVPLNEAFEGSYGSASAGQARPPALLGCRDEQRLRPCP